MANRVLLSLIFFISALCGAAIAGASDNGSPPDFQSGSEGSIPSAPDSEAEGGWTAASDAPADYLVTQTEDTCWDSEAGCPVLRLDFTLSRFDTENLTTYAWTDDPSPLYLRMVAHIQGHSAMTEEQATQYLDDLYNCAYAHEWKDIDDLILRVILIQYWESGWSDKCVGSARECSPWQTLPSAHAGRFVEQGLDWSDPKCHSVYWFAKLNERVTRKDGTLRDLTWTDFRPWSVINGAFPKKAAAIKADYARLKGA